MKNIKSFAAVLAMVLIVGATSIPVFASSYSYNMSTDDEKPGSHVYMDNSNKNFRIQYVNTVSGAHNKNDAATVKCYKDEWYNATYKPDDQTHLGNGDWTPWWGSCEDGDYNLVLIVNASGRTLSTNGTLENY